MSRRAYRGRLKRLSYVSKNSQDSDREMDLDRLDHDAAEAPLRKKVRRHLSVWELKKHSEHFKADPDHIYFKSNEQPGDNSFPNQKCTSSPRLSVTRSNSAPGPGTEVFTNGEGNVDTTSVGKERKCFSKNAVQARLNREKKKRYISSLETNNKNLQKKNEEILQQMTKQEKTIASLQYEVKYLTSLLANSKEISDILKSLRESTGLPVSSSLQSLVLKDKTEVLREDETKCYDNVYSKNPSITKNPTVKRVTSGCNFPIMQEDINLGSVYSTNDVHEETDISFSAESDVSLDSVFLNELDLDYKLSMFDCSLDPVYELDSNIKQEDSIDLGKLPDISRLESDVGLCLHVNKRKISVELCSICNNRALNDQVNDFSELNN